MYIYRIAVLLSAFEAADRAATLRKHFQSVVHGRFSGLMCDLQNLLLVLKSGITIMNIYIDRGKVHAASTKTACQVVNNRAFDTLNRPTKGTHRHLGRLVRPHGPFFVHR